MPDGRRTPIRRKARIMLFVVVAAVILTCAVVGYFIAGGSPEPVRLGPLQGR